MTAPPRLLGRLRCELVAIGGAPSFRVSVFVYVATLTVLAFGWADTHTFTRARRINEFLLAALLPWIAARCATVGGKDEGAPRATALTAGLLLVVITGLPVLVFAARIAAIGGAEFAGAVALPAGIALVAASTAIVARRLLGSPVSTWIAATIATGAVAILMVGR